MSDNREQEIQQPEVPEIEQQTIPEFDQSTSHPQGDDTRVRSETVRYENADSLYRAND